MYKGSLCVGADVRWVAAQVTQKSLEWAPYRYDAAVVRRNDPNKKRRWLIPLVLLAQIAFKVLVLDRVLEEDGITGDAYGPYDPEFVQEERERITREKVRLPVASVSGFSISPSCLLPIDAQPMVFSHFF